MITFTICCDGPSAEFQEVCTIAEVARSSFSFCFPLLTSADGRFNMASSKGARRWKRDTSRRRVGKLVEVWAWGGALFLPSGSDAASHVNIYKQLQAPKTPRGACRSQ
jgi:hypothetical protein